MQKEREINLPDLFYYVLTKWKVLIIAGVIGLILVGGYKFYSAEKARKAEAAEQETVESSDSSDLAAMSKEVLEKKNELLSLQRERSKVERQKKYSVPTEEELQIAEERIEEINKYLLESVLLHIDAMNAPKAEKTYQISVNSFLNPEEKYYRDPLDELVSAYGKEIVLDDEAAAEYQIAAKYLNELISVSVDKGANTVTVAAYGEDLAMAESVLADACAVLEARKENIEEMYRTHELTVVSETGRETADSGLASRQTQIKKSFTDYASQIRSSSTDALTQEEQDVKIALLDVKIADAEEKLEELEEPEEVVLPTTLSSIVKGIKFGIIGCVAFAILLGGVYFLIYVFNGKLHTVEELGNCFNIPLLAGLSAPFVKGCALDKYLYRLRNKGAGISNEVVLQTASVTISQLLGEAKTVAVISSLDEEALEPVTAGLAKFIPEVQFVSVADTNLSVEAAEKLKAVDAVIVYEKREVSCMREIEAELHQARLLEKNIIGYIVA